MIEFDIIIGHYNGDIYRDRNLKIALDYYTKKSPDSKIIVVEQKSKSDLSAYLNVKHITLDTGTDLYSRSLGFNEGIREVSKSMVLTVDNDCLVNPQILSNLESFIKKSQIFIPYNLCIDLSNEDTAHLQKTWKVIGGKSRGGVNTCTGGAMFITTEAFKKCGGYDTNIVGWGAEDTLFSIVSNSLYQVDRIDGKWEMFHLWHPSACTSNYLKSERYQKNLQILETVSKMSNLDLYKYIQKNRENNKFV